jgi:hypothetical protein
MTRPAFEPGKLASVGKVVQMRVNAIASLAVAALLALTLVAVALRGQGQAHVELAQDSTAGAGSRSLGHARQSGTPPDKAQSLVHRDLPGYIPGRGRERDLVAGSSAYRPPDTSQAPHDTVADRGSWWGDNDAWYDGWTQHKQDMQKPRCVVSTCPVNPASHRCSLDVAPSAGTTPSRTMARRHTKTISTSRPSITTLRVSSERPWRQRMPTIRRSIAKITCA